jgi:hypothetical protein
MQKTYKTQYLWSRQGSVEWIFRGIQTINHHVYQQRYSGSWNRFKFPKNNAKSNHAQVRLTRIWTWRIVQFYRNDEIIFLNPRNPWNNQELQSKWKNCQITFPTEVRANGVSVDKIATEISTLLVFYYTHSNNLIITHLHL